MTPLDSQVPPLTFPADPRALTTRRSKDCLFLFLVWIWLCQTYSFKIGKSRFQDEPFPPVMKILNAEITCGNYTPGKFVARTFTCADMRVNGRRMAYGYYAGWAVGQHDQRCQETAGVHEFGQLCLLLLRFIHKEGLGFKAAYIPRSTCSYINETRKLLKKVSPSQFTWTDFKAGWGWTDTIQCMTDLTGV